ncbi:MAG TPA: hypothetical protein VK013_07190 [Myxococcaceae bacterium]|nr:hypothetical protein [Myxococcaceae bacterium]
MSITSGRCANHPDRHGLGVCVECRKVVCEECTTRFEGINRCTTCLAKRQAALAQAPDIPEWSARVVIPAGLGVLLFLGLLSLLAGWGG